MKQLHSCHVKSQKGFSLIEVVLAIGIFLVTVLALVGLLGPTLQSVDEVEKTDEVSSIVNTINAFLQNSPEIAPGASRFNAIYNLVKSNDFAAILVFRAYDDNDVIALKIGFIGEGQVQVGEEDVTDGSIVKAAGTIYRAVLTASSVIPQEYLNETKPERNGDGIYTLKNPIADYLEGSFAMEVRIFAEEPSLSFKINNNIRANIEPIFTYNTAIVR